MAWEFPFIPACQRGLVISHINSFHFRFSHIQHTFVSFSGQPSRLPRGQPSSRHSSLSQQKRRRREEREEKGKEGKERRGKYDAPVNFITAASSYIYWCPCKRREVYACLSERVSHFTHTFVSFSGQPFTEASHPAGSPVRVKRLRQSTQLPLHTRKRREFPFMPACQRELVTSHIQSFLSQPIRHQPSICFLEGGGYQIQSVRVNLEGRGRFFP